MKNNFLFILLLTLCFPAISFGAEYHAMEIDFSFTADPARNLHGYRLFEEGKQVCETTDPSVSKISCDVLTEAGTFNFTLAAYYYDGTQSPSSPPFPVTIVSTKAKQVAVIVSNFLLLKDKH